MIHFQVPSRVQKNLPLIAFTSPSEQASSILFIVSIRASVQILPTNHFNEYTLLLRVSKPYSETGCHDLISIALEQLTNPFYQFMIVTAVAEACLQVKLIEDNEHDVHSF